MEAPKLDKASHALAAVFLLSVSGFVLIGCGSSAIWAQKDQGEIDPAEEGVRAPGPSGIPDADTINLSNPEPIGSPLSTDHPPPHEQTPTASFPPTVTSTDTPRMSTEGSTGDHSWHMDDVMIYTYGSNKTYLPLIARDFEPPTPTATPSLTPTPTNPVSLPDGPLSRDPNSPILTNGPESYDLIKAGPRAVLKLGVNDYRMWYEAVPAEGDTSVAYATSADGINWVKQGPVMFPDQSWEVDEVSPQTVIFEDGLLKMWYHGGGNTAVRQIGYADSIDGLAWIKTPQNPILSPDENSWDFNVVAEPKVVKKGSEYWMFYGGLGSDCWSIGLAKSSDGINFVKDANNPVFGPGPGWDSATVSLPGIVLDNGTLHMWYAGGSNSSNCAGDALGYAHSQDGVNWTRGLNNPVLFPLGQSPETSIGDSIFAYVDVDEYVVLYGAFDFASNPIIRGIGRAIHPRN